MEKQRISNGIIMLPAVGNTKGIPIIIVEDGIFISGFMYKVKEEVFKTLNNKTVMKL